MACKNVILKHKFKYHKMSQMLHKIPFVTFLFIA